MLVRESAHTAGAMCNYATDMPPIVLWNLLFATARCGRSGSTGVVLTPTSTMVGVIAPLHSHGARAADSNMPARAMPRVECRR